MNETLDRVRSALAGRYAVERELGAGGMATVYLAKDVRHDRRVAVKVLRPELAAVLGADRFLNEIKVTANLQHPHILPLHDSGQADSVVYYVMPYVEGESRRERLRRETQLPVEEAVRIAREIASALDYAHRHGVIHRDIKPENILLQEGSALVADFGIALAVRNAGGARLTETGLSLGTPQYMSPEQATAEREVGPRSDVYSLGCVVYEMLAGEPPHTGPSSQTIIAKLMTEEPRRLGLQRKTVPPHIEAAVHRSLQKLAADRFTSAGAFAEALAHAGTADTMPAFTATGVSQSPRRRQWPLGAVAGWVVAAALLAALLLRPGGKAHQPLHFFNLALPDSAPLDFFAPSFWGEGQPALAISRDGATLAYVARRHETTQLYVRRLDEREFRPLAGTEGASQPFFSPGGEWIGFFSNGELKKVSVAGGDPITLARVGIPRGGVWSRDGRMLVSHNVFGAGPTLSWVAASGGDLVPVHAGPGQFDSPDLLPGEQWALGSSHRRLLLFSLRDGRTLGLASSGAVPIATADTAELLNGSFPRYASDGHLVYLSGNTLMALPFDAQRLRVLGPPVPVEQGARRESFASWGQFALAEDGTLVFAPGTDAARSVLVWADRAGRVLDTLPVPSGDHYNIYVSRDGRQVALTSYAPSGRSEVVVADLEHGLSRSLPIAQRYFRLTGFWRDGSHVVVVEGSATDSSTWRSYLVSLAGSSRPDTLWGPGWRVFDASPDGRYLAAMGWRDSSGVWLLPVGRNEAPVRLNQYGTFPVFSPDGRWVAYSSNDGIQVSPVPATGAVQTVAPASGDEPVWSPRGDELYYREGKRWMSIPVTSRGRLVAGKPRLLFEGRFANVDWKSYDVAPDGRFLLLLGPPEQTVGHLNVVTNFFAEIEKR